MKPLNDTELEARRKEAEFTAKVWKMNMERNRLVPPQKVDKSSETV